MSGTIDRKHHVCPWHHAYLFDNPLRFLVHNPRKMLGPYVKPGMTVLDLGCGMGFFSVGMAKLVGPQGKVLSVDLQKEMLGVLGKRVQRRGLSDRVEKYLMPEGVLPVNGPLDFALCFWMVHEVPDQDLLFRELGRVLKPGAKVFIAEPSMHVEEEELLSSISRALAAGFSVTERPKVRMSRAVVLEKEKSETGDKR